MMMAPRTICCWLYSSPRISIPLLIIPISSEPTSAPITEPRPPNRLVPPSTTAARPDSPSPPPPEQARPAERDRGDHRQLVPLAPGEAAGLQPPGVEHARQRGDDRGGQH